MGQYHKFINFDKKEICDSPSLCKLMEWSYQGNYYMNAVGQLLEGRWNGDRVLCVGDYVEGFYANPKFKEIFDDIISENQNQNCDNIYYYDYKEINLNSSTKLFPRYIYNNKSRQYIDLKRQPIQWCYYDEEKCMVGGIKINPLSLLLSCSNGAGGGDYYGLNSDKVGMWVGESEYLELSNEVKDNDYKELLIIFSETKTIQPNIEILSDFIVERYKANKIADIYKIQFDNDLFLTNQEKTDIRMHAINKCKIQNNKLQITKSDIEEEIDK